MISIFEEYKQELPIVFATLLCNCFQRYRTSTVNSL
jgi:hypothetical protein